MALAYRRNPHDPKNNAYVARITLCKGVPMYGFHVGWKFYLKIYMLNPAHMQRLADLLRTGSIMGRPMQPYEVHIPYLLQFMADFGLYGCGWVECQKVTFRAPVPEHDSIDQNQIWSTMTIPSHLITSSNDKPRLSHCAIEIDLLSHHIGNRDTIKPRLLHHDFIERTNPIPATEKLVHSMAELWRDEERRRLSKGDTEHMPSMYTSGSRHDQDDRGKGPWIHEAEMRAKLDDLIRSERERSDFHALQFDTFVKPAKFQSLVQTALESVSDMFPNELPAFSQPRDDYVGIHTSSGHLREDSNDFPTADIDRDRIFEMLNNFEASAHESVNGDEFVSESPSESPSEVDFDGDLLGRKLDGTAEPDVTEDGLDVFDYLPLETPIDTNVADFSDDLDINFDVSFGAQASKTDEEHVSDFGGEQAIPGKGNDRQLMRLRGGASEKELRKRKRPPSSSPSGRKKAKVHFSSSSGGHLSAQGNSSSGLISGFVAGTEKSNSDPTNRRRAQRPHAVIQLSPPTSNIVYTWRSLPPSTPELRSSMDQLGILHVIPRSAYYSRDQDVPASTREYGGREFKLVSTSLPYLDEFNSGTNFRKSILLGKPSPDTIVRRLTRIWEIGKRPPILLRHTVGPANGEPSSSLKPGNVGISSD